MNCSKCGTLNDSSSKFCIGCGNALEVMQNPTPVVDANQTLINNYQTPNNGVINNTVNTVSENQTNANLNVSSAPLNYLMYIVAILMKPFQCFREEEAKLSDPKTSIILSVIISGVMMLINLITSMINVVFTKSLDFSTFEYKTKIEFSNLKNLDYLELIGKNFLIYIVIIFAIAVVYYLATLVAKKQLNFMKMLSISSTSLIPFIAGSMILGPILSKVWAPLSMIFMVVGVIYSFIIFITLVNECVKFDNKDHTIYFNTICLSVLIIAGYYVLMNLLTSGLGDLSSFLDLLG